MQPKKAAQWEPGIFPGIVANFASHAMTLNTSVKSAAYALS